LCGAVPEPATVCLWTASRRSYRKRRNRLGRAGLCQTSTHSLWPIAKRRIQTSASVMQGHRKRLSHQERRARSRGLHRSSATRRHRKQSSPPRDRPTLPQVPRKRRQNKTERVRAGLRRAKADQGGLGGRHERAQGGAQVRRKPEPRTAPCPPFRRRARKRRGRGVGK
jgi:hypothetical protein